MNNRLVLGTAQLGLSYGVANKTGQPSQSEATAIVSEAWENGIHEFDTAQSYGESESVLGKSLFQLKIADQVKVITKFHPSLNHLDYAVLENSIAESLKKIRVPQIYGIMLHREEMLNLWHNGLSEILLRFIAKGIIKKIGISVYSPDKAIEAINTAGIDMVQVPTNILDRRFERAGVFAIAEAKKKEIYIRSVFLQGLLLMKKSALTKAMHYAMPVIEKTDTLCRELKLSRQELCFGYIKQKYPNAFMIVGAETQQQLADNLTAWQSDQALSITAKVDEIFTDIDERIINPTLWPH